MAKEVQFVDCIHQSGILGVNKGAGCRLTVNDDSLKIKRIIGGVFKPKFGDTYSIPASKVISVDVISEKELSEKSKSVIGRGIAGALIFGPVGAIIGGMSGIGTKTTTNSQYFINIAYYNAAQVLEIIVMQCIEVSKSFDLARQFMQRHVTPDLQRNESGEILL